MNYDECEITPNRNVRPGRDLCSLHASHIHAQQVDPAKAAGLHGGLVVQLGAGDTQAAAELSLTGRYLIHVLDCEADEIQRARSRLREDGHYGLAWAEHVSDTSRLPYAENIVNLIVVRDYTVGVEELSRVLTPGGSVVVTNTDALNTSQLEAGGFQVSADADLKLIARKPWPEAMDVWSHPRHAADGNPVSGDTLVGPPDRVRWIAAATSEVEGMVTAGGRNFYGGILSRDSFNGLRLWHRDLKQGENNSSGFELPRLAANDARPIASERLLFAVLQNRPVALDAATGEVVVEFGDMVKPTAIVHDGRRVIAADDDSVQAFNIDSGQQIWKVTAGSPNNLIADGDTVAFIHGRIRRGEKAEAVALNAETGTVRWRRDDYPWLSRTTRTVLAKGLLVFEVSTLNDDDAGNGIHVVSVDPNICHVRKPSAQLSQLVPRL